MLKKGLLVFDLAWYEVFWGLLPFASLLLKAASPHHHGGISPTVASFTRVLPTLEWRCPATGRPSLSKSFLMLRKFLSDTSALDIKFNVRNILLPLGTSLVRVGYGKDA